MVLDIMLEVETTEMLEVRQKSDEMPATCTEPSNGTATGPPLQFKRAAKPEGIRTNLPGVGRAKS